MATGLDAQLGLAEETTWGTFVAPARWQDFSSESLGQTIDRNEMFALKAPGRVIKTGRWTAGKVGAQGDVEMAVFNKGQGLLWKHALGNISTANPATGVYVHTATPADLLGKGLSLQVGRPFIDSSTPQAFSYLGMKVASFSVSGSVDSYGQLTMSFVGKTEDTAQALGTYSAVAGLKMIPWTSTTLTIAGSSVNVSEVTLEGNNNLSDDRYILGSATRREPLETNVREYSGTLSMDFLSTAGAGMAAYNRFINGTEATLVILFQGDVITGGHNFETKFTMNVRFDGNTPNVADGGEMRLPLAYKVIDTGSQAITVDYKTSDAAP